MKQFCTLSAVTSWHQREPGVLDWLSFVLLLQPSKAYNVKRCIEVEALLLVPRRSHQKIKSTMTCAWRDGKHHVLCVHGNPQQLLRLMSKA